MRKTQISPAVLISGILAVWLLCGIFRLEEERDRQGVAQLEESLRRAAVSCYAQEGFYPPSAEYLMDHYALRYDEDRYFVHYESCGSNRMPHIRVLLKP